MKFGYISEAELHGQAIFLIEPCHSITMIMGMALILIAGCILILGSNL